jgi:hypothetical protein
MEGTTTLHWLGACFDASVYVLRGWPRREGGSLGALSHAIVVDQFTRLRDGDRWWYENPGVLDVPTLRQIQATSWVRVSTVSLCCAGLCQCAYKLLGAEVFQ